MMAKDSMGTKCKESRVFFKETEWWTVTYNLGFHFEVLYNNTGRVRQELGQPNVCRNYT